MKNSKIILGLLFVSLAFTGCTESVEKTSERMKSIKLSSPVLREASIVDVAAYISERSKNSDPTGKGVLVELDEALLGKYKGNFGKDINISIRDEISVMDFLLYCCNLKGANFRIKQGKAVIEYCKEK